MDDNYQEYFILNYFCKKQIPEFFYNHLNRNETKTPRLAKEFSLIFTFINQYLFYILELDILYLLFFISLKRSELFMDSDQWQYLSFHYRRTLSLESSSSFPSLPDQYNVCSLIDVLLLPIIRYDVEVNVSYVKLFMYIFMNNKTCNFD